MLRYVAGALALGLAFAVAGCGESEEDRVRSAIEGLQSDFAARDFAAVCAALAERPKYQIGTVGHGRKPTTCERDLRELVAGLGENPGLGEDRRPDVAKLPKPAVDDVELKDDRAVASLRLADDLVDVPMVRRGGDWKLDDFWVVTGPVRRDLR
jgi:hypothetical protein